MAMYAPTFSTSGRHLLKTFRASKILTCLTTYNLCPYSYVEGENTTQTEIGEGPTCFPKTLSEKKNIY